MNLRPGILFTNSSFEVAYEILSLAKVEARRIEMVSEPFDVVQTLNDIGQVVMSQAGTKSLREILDAMFRPLGTEYLHGDLLGVPAPQKTTALTAEMLSELPGELHKEFREPILALNGEAALAVIERVVVQAPDTAKRLQALAVNFQMGRISELHGAVH